MARDLGRGNLSLPEPEAQAIVKCAARSSHNPPALLRDWLPKRRSPSAGRGFGSATTRTRTVRQMLRVAGRGQVLRRDAGRSSSGARGDACRERRRAANPHDIGVRVSARIKGQHTTTELGVHLRARIGDYDLTARNDIDATNVLALGG